MQKVRRYMRYRWFAGRSRRFSVLFLLGLVLIISACGGAQTSTTPQSTKLAAQQVLAFPNVGTRDISVMDPAQGPDSNSAQAMGMIYSGLVRLDQQQNVLADQATWTISADRKTYTFTLKPGLTFSDGTPLDAQTYVYTLTRALLPA